MIVADPRALWAIAVMVSVYYGVRGIVIEVRDAKVEDAELVKQGKLPWCLWQRVFVHYVHTFILNTFCCLAGFLAMSVAGQVYEQAGSVRQLESGTAILLGFLALVAITGITGILPEILYRGRLFGPK